VTCEEGVRKREFIVLSPAKAGGHPCEFKHGYIQEDTCGLASRKCPPTTAKTTTIATTTTTTTISTTTTAVATTASAKSYDSDESPDIDGGDSGNGDDGKSAFKTVDEAKSTTIATILMTSSCMIYSYMI